MVFSLNVFSKELVNLFEKNPSKKVTNSLGWLTEFYKLKKPNLIFQREWALFINETNYQILTRFSGARYNESVGLILNAS